jgi:hypothetical protein
VRIWSTLSVFGLEFWMKHTGKRRKTTMLSTTSSILLRRPLCWTTHHCHERNEILPIPQTTQCHGPKPASTTTSTGTSTSGGAAGDRDQNGGERILEYPCHQSALLRAKNKGCGFCFSIGTTSREVANCCRPTTSTTRKAFSRHRAYPFPSQADNHPRRISSSIIVASSRDHYSPPAAGKSRRRRWTPL